MENWINGNRLQDWIVDESSIKEIDEILNEMRVKSCLEPLSDVPGMRIAKSRKGGSAHLGRYGSYFAGPNSIVLSSDLDEMPQPVGLMALIHERVHARSFNAFRALGFHNGRILSILNGIRKLSFSKVRSGYSHWFSSELTGFNEGVTQMITEEAYDEFVRRNGLSSLKISRTNSGVWDWVDESGEYECRFAPYHAETESVRKIIHKLAESLGMPEDVVWGSLKQGYFEGLDLLGVSDRWILLAE